MKMGAIIGGADEQEAGKVYSIGETLGLAFQLQDDYLDVYGNEAVFGKKTGGDIVNNKKTFLLIRALSKAEGKTHDELLRLTSGTAMDEKEKIAAVTAIYDSLHIGEDTSAVINNYFDGCRAILSSLSISAEARRPLGEYIYSLLGRKY
jgi:geranylgeranyl diphosphate synthase type II